MTRHWIGCLSIIMALIIGACSSTAQNADLPTLAVLPSATVTDTPTPTDTPTATHTALPPTWTFTPSATHTFTPRPTHTSLPTWTALPSETATATVTPTPPADAYVSNPAGVHVRLGPSTRFNPPIETLDRDDLINIIAISTGHDWYKVSTPSGKIGWVFGELISFYREITNIPEEFIPTPTATQESGGGITGGGIITGGGNTAQTAGFDLGGQALSFSYPDQMRNAGMTWVKRQIRWNGSDPASAFQHVIDTGKAQGFRVLLSVVGNAGQIAANPAGYYQTYANFVGGLAAGGADGIEIWNEENIDREWPSGLIGGANYTQLLSTAFQAIKSRNSATLVISGAPSPTGFFQGCSASGGNDDCFIREMAGAGASQFLDCVGVHYNSGITPPDATSGANVGSSGHYSWYFPSMISLYSSVFPGKPLCFTELGYVTGEGIGALPPSFSWASGNTLANQSDWLAGAVTRARQGGIRLLIVWNVDATGFGADPQAGYAIVRPGGGCPACNALRSAMG